VESLKTGRFVYVSFNNGFAGFDAKIPFSDEEMKLNRETVQSRPENLEIAKTTLVRFR
jgi:hypothetical protein